MLKEAAVFANIHVYASSKPDRRIFAPLSPGEDGDGSACAVEGQ